jgi:hypothetical protein
MSGVIQDESKIGVSGKSGAGPWLVFRYLPTAFFSLRMTHATSKGGKTLLVPTPYAVKLAFVDACFRMKDESLATEVLDWIKGREVRVSPPEHCIVQNTFQKVLQADRNAPKGYFSSTIAYREFCFYWGELNVALVVSGLSSEQIENLGKIAAHINYFGKRGSFVQFLGCETSEILPHGFTHPGDDPKIRSKTYGVSNFLDDFGEDAFKDKKLFERISTYGKGPAPLLGKHRILVPTLLPYRLERSSRGFTHYKRIDAK